MTSRLLRLSTFTAGLLIFSASYQAANSIAANASSEMHDAACLLALGVGFVGMLSGGGMVWYAVTTREE